MFEKLLKKIGILDTNFEKAILFWVIIISQGYV